MISRATFYDVVAVLAASAVVIAGLYYAYVEYVFDEKTFLVSVATPLVLGSAILAVRKKRILVFAFLAYIWAVVDDAPVFFDSVLTWPEVTRFHPFLPRLVMNIIIHSLTIFFLYLTTREAMKGRDSAQRKTISVALLLFIAFVLAYAQNIPLAIIQNAVQNSWYQFDVAEKLASFAFLYLAIRIAKLP